VHVHVAEYRDIIQIKVTARDFKGSTAVLQYLLTGLLHPW
jgi:hypothetical protein